MFPIKPQYLVAKNSSDASILCFIPLDTLRRKVGKFDRAHRRELTARTSEMMEARGRHNAWEKT